MVFNYLKQDTSDGCKAYEMCDGKLIMFNPNSCASFF
jgi:hypothetical protein